MKLKTAWFPVFALLLLGCSKDDQPVTETGMPSQVPDFIVLGEDVSNLYQYTYSAGNDTAELVNLSQENNLGGNFITLRQVGEVLTFYTFSSGSFSAVQRNVRTGESRELPNFYTTDGNRSVVWGTNSDTSIFLGYYSPPTTSDFGIQTLDISSGSSTDLPLAFDVDNVYEPLFHKDLLLVPYADARGTHTVVVIDAVTSTIRRTLVFGPAIPSFYIEASGNIAIITRTNDTSYTHSLYDFNTLELLETEDFSVNRFFAPGPLEAKRVNGKLYYANFYAQPSPVSFGPAVYDFNTGENRVIDMIGIVQQLQETTGATISLTAFGYEASGNSFLIGYTRDYSNGAFEGGIMVISPAGDLLRTLETPFIPIYFVNP